MLAALGARGDRVVAYSRSPGDTIAGADEVRGFREDGALDLDGLDAVVHLAGESIFGVWTAAKRERIRRSRVVPTRGLAARIAEAASAGRGPLVLVCASAAGWYGDRGDEVLNESAGSGDGFLASVCRDWEAAAATAGSGSGAREVRLRFGMVLGRGGGAASLLGKVFGLGLGGTIGDGRQWMPWIHLDDAAGLVLHALDTASLSGAVNAVAPGVVRNREFTECLARRLRRPAVLPAPRFVVRGVLGDLSELLLSSQRLVPEAAVASGFRFRFPELEGALADVFG